MDLLPVVGAAVIVGAAVGAFASVMEWREEASLTLSMKRGLHHCVYGLVHGGTSEDYYDLDEALADPEVGRLIARKYQAIIEQLIEEVGPIDKLLFIEKRAGPVGAITLKDALTHRTGIPAITVRTRRRVQAGMVKGPFSRGERAILITDVLTSGRTILEPIQKIQQLGLLQVVAVVGFLLRRREVEAELASKRVVLRYAAGPEDLESAKRQLTLTDAR